jgi:hypothetical protein
LGPRFSPLGHWSAVGAARVQAALRRAFARWGRPQALRVDNGQPWAQPREDLPTELGLWLAGVGVALHYNPPRQPYRNGVIERSQGVAKAWAEPHTCKSPRELQRRLAVLDELQRAEYPGPDGRPRLAAFPGLARSGRRYSRAWERRHWDLRAARELLAGYVVPRRVRGGGHIAVYGRDLHVGPRQAGRTVLVSYDPDAREWIASDERGTPLRRWPAPEIGRARILGLRVCRR